VAIVGDGSGNIYISDFGNDQVLKETPGGNGYTATVVANAASGLVSPRGLAVDSLGNVYIADYGGQQLWVAPWTGSGYGALRGLLTQGVYAPADVTVNQFNYLFFTNYTAGGDPGVYAISTNGSGFLTETQYLPSAIPGMKQALGVAWQQTGTATGNLFVTDYLANQVAEARYNGGWGAAVILPVSGLSNPTRIAVDPSGDLFLADSGNNRVIELPWNTVTSGWSGQIPVPSSALNDPQGTGLDASGNLYIADMGNQRVLKESLAGAGFGANNVGSSAGPEAVFFTFATAGSLGGTAVLTQGASGLDFANSRAKTTCKKGTSYNQGDSCAIYVTFTPEFPGPRYGAALLEDGSGNVLATAYLEGMGSAPQVAFPPGMESSLPLQSINPPAISQPLFATVDTSGNVYTTDYANKAVLKETPSYGTYQQTIVASGLADPRNLAVDGAGNVYIADYGGHQLYVAPWTGSAYGNIQPLLTGATYSPHGVAVDGFGNVYFTSWGDSHVYALAKGSAQVTPLVDVSGSGELFGLAFDASGDLLISDYGGSQILELPWTAAGWGTLAPLALTPTVSNPGQIALDGSGTLYIANLGQNQVVKVVLNGAQSGSLTPVSTASALNQPRSVALDGAGNLYIADYGNFRVLEEDLADAPTLNFQPTQLTSTSSDSAQTVVVENIGNESLLFQQGYPEYATDFPVALGGSSLCSYGTPLLPASACDLNIDFIPTTVGPLSEFLTLEDNNLNAAGQANGIQSISVNGTGLPWPMVQVSPSSVAFGTQVDGTTANAWTLNMSNTSGLPVTGISMSMGGANPSDFAFQSACGTTLGAYSSCNILVTFTPSVSSQAAVQYSAQLSIADDAYGNPQVIPLSGTGTAMNVLLNPNPVNFSNQTVGGSSGPQTATLANANSGTLTLTSITLSDPDFAFSTTTCGIPLPTSTGQTLLFAANTTLAPNGSCSISMTFTPQNALSYSAQLTVNDNGQNGWQSVAVTGTGTGQGQAVFLSPTNVSFSNQTVGSTGNAWTITFNNTSSVALTGVAISLADSADFSQTNNCATTVPAYTTCNIQVSFTPQSATALATLLKVASSAGLFTASLNGTGTPATAALAPSQLNFSSVPQGLSSTQNAQLTNTSGGPLSNVSITLSNNSGNPASSINPNGFFISSTTCAGTVSSSGTSISAFTLPANSNCTLTMTFNPQAAGDYWGTLKATGGGAITPQTVPLVGVGVSSAGNIYFSPNSINFGNQTAGSASNAWGMTLNNSGSSNVTISAAGLSLSDTNNFTLIAPDACAGVTLGPGNPSCSFQVVFNPPAAWPPAETTLPVTPAPIQAAAMVVDASGDVYVSDFGNDQVVELMPAGSGYTQTVIANSAIGGLVSPRGLALDSSGNLYIADYGGNQILKVACASGCGTPAQLVIGLGSGPQDLAFDPYGYLWFTGGASVWSVPTSGGTPVNYSGIYFSSTPFSQVGGLAWQTTVNTAGSWQGNLFISDYNLNTVTEWTWNGSWVLAGTVPISGLTPGLSNPTRMSVDSAGDLYIADTGNNRIVKVPWTGSAWGAAVAVPTSALNQPVDVAIDTAGSLYIADWMNHRVLKEVFGTLGAHAATLTATYSGSGGGTASASFTGTSIASTVSLSPGSLSFGNQIQDGKSAPQTVTVTDTSSSGPVNISGIALSDSMDFTVSGGTCTNTTILTAANPSCTIQVEFTPQTVSTFAGVTLSVSDSAAASPQRVSLSGTGISNVPNGSFDPGSIGFGSQTLGSSSNTWGMTLNNTGGVAIQNVGVQASVEFSILSDNCSGSTLGVGRACSFQVAFTPTATGSQTGTVKATYDNGSGATLLVTANLSGNGTAPTVSISPSSINFANVIYGSQSPEQFVTLSNTSAGPLNIGSISAGSGPFFIDTGASTCGSTLSPSHSCAISVYYKPTAAGINQSGTLTISDNASSTPQSVPLYGNGTAASQTITFAWLGAAVSYGVGPISLSATASSNLPVTFSIASGPGAINGNALSITGAGTVVVAANQSGNQDYAAAPSVTQSLVVNKASVALTNLSATPITYGQQLSKSTLSGSATATILGVSTTVPGTFAWSSPSLTPAAGSLSESVTFTPTDTADFSTAAGSVTITVSQATPSISLSCSPNPVTYLPGATQTAVCTATVGGGASGMVTMNWGPGTSPGTPTPNLWGTATLSNGRASLTGFNGLTAGGYTVSANYSGDANHNAASATATETINKLSPSITLGCTPNPVTYLAGAAQTATCTATVSGGATGTVNMYWTAAGSSTKNPWGTPTLSNGSVSLTGFNGLTAGSYTIEADYLGDVNSNSATTTTTEIISQATPVITTWPTAGLIVAGEKLSASPLTGGTSSVPGVFAWLAPNKILGIGTSGEIAVFTPTDTIDYLTVTQQVQVTVNSDGSAIIGATSYSLAASQTTVTLQAGQNATVALALIPSSGFSGTVSLSCSDLPAGVSCSFAPSALIADGSGVVQTSQLTIATNATAAANSRGQKGRPGTALAGLLVFPSILFGGILAWHRRKLSNWAKQLLLAGMVLSTLAGISGCSASMFTQDTTGTHQISVNATSSANGSSTIQTGVLTLTITQ
jgi:sugar lactone lactonase YvrE